MGQSKRTQSAAFVPSPPSNNEKGTGTVERRQLKGKVWKYRAKKRRSIKLADGSEKVETYLGPWRTSRLNADTDRINHKWAELSGQEYPTFRSFWSHHMQTMRPLEASAETIGKDEILWRTRIVDSDLGKRRIHLITKDDVESWIADQTHRLVFVPKRAEDGRVLYSDENGVVVYSAQAGTIIGSILPTEKPLAVVTRRGYLGKLHLYFEAAANKPYSYIRANPAAGIKIKKERKDVKEEKKRKSLGPSESVAFRGGFLKFATMQRKTSLRFEAMNEAQLNSGLRIGEVLGLRWPNLIYRNRSYFLVVEKGLIEAQTGGQKLNATKTGKVRTIQISTRVAQLLLALPRRSEYIFTTASGKPVAPHNYHRDFRKFRRMLGLPGLTPHNLRKTYATLLFAANKTPKEVQDLLGHRDSRMVMEVYAEFQAMHLTSDAGDTMETMLARMAELAKEQASESQMDGPEPVEDAR